MLALVPHPPTDTAADRRFALTFARALRRYGSPAHDVEEGFERFALRIGETVRVHVLPTSLIATDPAQDPPIAWFYPEGTREMALDRLESTHEVADSYANGTLDADQGLRALAAIASAPPVWSALATTVAAAATSAAGAAYLGGGLAEAVVASALGAGAVAVAGALRSRPSTTPLVEVFVSFLVGFSLHGVGAPVAAEIVILASLITFLPGFALTTALSELATGHRMTGTGGLVTAATTLLQLGFGVALGTRVGALAFGALPSATVQPFPAWHVPITTAVFAATLVVALQIRGRWLPAVFAACAAAVAGESLGVHWLGRDLGGALGALAAAVVAGGFARMTGRPAATLLVPGLLVLVPGTIGFRAVQALVGQDVQGGVESAFSMVLGATGLAGGALLGAALVGRSAAGPLRTKPA